MNQSFSFFLLSLLLNLGQLIAQNPKKGFNYQEGTLTLKNGTLIQGQVANLKYGFRDKWLKKVRIKPIGKILAKKYRPSQILAYSIGERQFVSWRVKRNNKPFKEAYTLHQGKSYKIFEQYKQGPLSIYLDYFLDEDLHLRSAPFFLKQGDLIMVRATQGLFGLKQNLASSYFTDCPPLAQLIKQKKLKTVEEVADFYNHYKTEELKQGQ